MKLYTAYLLNSEVYATHELFDMPAESPIEVLEAAREWATAKGIRLVPPLSLDVRQKGKPGMDMRRRYNRIHGVTSTAKGHKGKAYDLRYGNFGNPKG